MTGWQSQSGPGMPDPYGPPGQQQQPWGSSASDYEHEQPPVDSYGRHQPYNRPRTEDDPIPLPDKRGKGMYVAAAAGGVVVLLMIGAIVYAVLGGGTENPAAASGLTSTPIPGGAVDSGSGGSGAPSSSTGAGKDVTLVADTDGYKLWTGPLADQAVAGAKKHELTVHPGAGEQINASKFGIYKKGTSQLIVISLTANADPALAAHIHQVGQAKAVDDAMGRGTYKPKSFPAGPKGGVIRCLPATETSGPTVRCGWADDSTLVVLEANKITESRMAALTLAYRNAAES